MMPPAGLPRGLAGRHEGAVMRRLVTRQPGIRRGLAAHHYRDCRRHGTRLAPPPPSPAAGPALNGTRVGTATGCPAKGRSLLPPDRESARDGQ
jgi:hypothetical protein